LLREPKVRPVGEMDGPRETQAVKNSPFSARWMAIAAAIAVAFGGAYGGFEYMRWVRDADARREAATATAQRLAALDAERQLRDAAQRQEKIEADLRRREAATGDAADIERQRKEEAERVDAGEKTKQQSTQCERAQRLHLKGLQAIEEGDIYSAREFFRIGADAGLPQSATALAGTYDPAELPKLKVVGVEPDAKAAQRWYDKAQALRTDGPLSSCAKVELQASPSPKADLTQFRAAYISGDGLAYVVIKDEKGDRIFRYGDESRLAARLGTRGYTLFTCNEPLVLSPVKEEDAAMFLKATVVMRDNSQFADLDAKYVAMCNNSLVKSAIPKN
jgi:TPR repeat protein